MWFYLLGGLQFNPEIIFMTVNKNYYFFLICHFKGRHLAGQIMVYVGEDPIPLLSGFHEDTSISFSPAGSRNGVLLAPLHTSSLTLSYERVTVSVFCED